jgi:hypothetical protein
LIERVIPGTIQVSLQPAIHRNPQAETASTADQHAERGIAAAGRSQHNCPAVRGGAARIRATIGWFAHALRIVRGPFVRNGHAK